VQKLSAFRRGADRAPQTEGYGPSYAHIHVPVDKTGRIARMAHATARVPRDRIRSYTAAQLDAYVNELLRSLKNYRDGDALAGHLDAARSLPYLLEAIFGSEGRWAPYAKYLEWELREFPLADPPLPNQRFLNLLRRILRDGDVRTQRVLYRRVQRNFRAKGYGRVLDSWQPDQRRFLLHGPAPAKR
jgi:hypothetical protein